jgi:hypothetical protein
MSWFALAQHLWVHRRVGPAFLTYGETCGWCRLALKKIEHRRRESEAARRRMTPWGMSEERFSAEAERVSQAFTQLVNGVRVRVSHDDRSVHTPLARGTLNGGDKLVISRRFVAHLAYRLEGKSQITVEILEVLDMPDGTKAIGIYAPYAPPASPLP